MTDASVSASGRAVKHHAACLHADEAVAVAAREFEGMEIAEHGECRSAVEIAKGIHDGLRVARVERGHGFVREDDLRVLHERACDRHALLLAAGQALGPLGREVAKIEPVEGREGH